MKIKEAIITVVFIIILLLVFYFFPINNLFQKEATLLIFFIILPIVFNKFVLKKKISSMGLQIGDWRKGLIWSGISLLLAALIFVLLSQYFGFLRYYKIADFIASNFWVFVFYEMLWVALTVMVYDFFFRGFIMFNLAPWARQWSVLIQALVFSLLVVLLVFIGGAGSIWSFVPFLVFAPFAGIVAYKSGSIIYSSGAQILMFVILDATVVRLVK